MGEFRRRITGRWFLLGMFAIFGVVALVLLGAVLTGGVDGPLVGFSVLWIGVLGWNAYWWLFRLAVAVRLDGDVLRWEAPLRSGSIPLGDLTDVHPMPLLSSVEVFERRAGRPVLIMATKGLSAFLDQLSVARPDLAVRLGWHGRLAERLPGWSGWRNGGDR